ncbi:putative prophage phiRv2 integrase [subsurface metagenome]
MKGSIRQRSKGSWEVCIDTGRDPATGKRLRHFESVKGTKKAAQQRMHELLYTLEQGAYIRPSRLTVAQFLGEWLRDYVELNCSPRTKASYEMIIRCHLIPELGSISLSQLEPRHLQAFYRRQRERGRVDGKGQLSPQTVRYCHSLLAEALGYAVKMGLLSRNVAQATEAPRAEHKVMPTLAPEDVPRFLEAAQESPYYTLFYLLLHTGLRRGEALALRWKNVDLGLASLGVSAYLSVVETAYKLNGTCIIKEPKTSHSRRRIALSPSLALVLRQHRAEQEAQRALLGKPLTGEDFVFAHLDGTPLDPSTVSHTFNKIIRRAGLPHIRLHDLRHTHASLLLQAGTHPKIVQERLGHSSIRVTLDTYSHVIGGLQEVAAQRFDDLLAARGVENVGKMSAKAPKDAGK